MIEIKGRPSDLLKKFFNLMTRKINGVVAIGLVVLAAAAVVLIINGMKLPEYSSFFIPKAKGINPPKATGSIDGAVDALISDSLSEKTLAQDEEKDADLINLDSQEIGNFVQLYENEL